jgi:hypothetical protein
LPYVHGDPDRSPSTCKVYQSCTITDSKRILRRPRVAFPGRHANGILHIWCSYARTRSGHKGFGSCRRRPVLSSVRYVCSNHPRIKWLIAKDIEFNNRGTILSTFIQQCRPQPNYKPGRPNFLAFDRTGKLPSGRKVRISGRHRLRTTHVLFASGGAYHINPVIDESVKIPQMASRVGVVALVGTVLHSQYASRRMEQSAR